MDEKWEFSRVISLLQQSFQSSRVRLLEIGVGRGAFHKQAREAGFDVSGVELNSDAAAAARRQGFVIYGQDLASLCDEYPLHWDALCAFQVLEHLPDPKLFIDQALLLLKPGGLLILSVPNAEVASFLDPERTNLLDQPPHHMTHWNVAVFKYLEKLFPVRLCDLSFEPLAIYHIGWFMGAWSARVGSTVGRRVQKLCFNRFSIPLIHAFLAVGARRLIKGHTLLVAFSKC